MRKLYEKHINHTGRLCDSHLVEFFEQSYLTLPVVEGLLEKLYRVMCEDEALKTIANGRPNFIKRFKWFSDSLSFIKDRVQDGRFNNSGFVSGRYSRVFEFETEDLHKSLRVSAHEVQFDRRSNSKIVLVRELL